MGAKGGVRVMVTVRNRLSLTKYTLNQLFNNSKGWNLEVFLYDNLSNLHIPERFDYYSQLVEQGKLAQFTFNTAISTNNAFSKAAANNQFADFHMSSLNKKKIKYLVMLDNDMLCLPGWLDSFHQAWEDVLVQKLENQIFIVTQKRGGIMHGKNVNINGRQYLRGKYGGSGCWIVRSNFFDKIGKLNLQKLVGRNKRHDQMYWFQIPKKTKSSTYIIGVPCKKVMHLGGVCGSVCNALERRDGKSKEKMKKIEHGFKNIKGLTPEQIAKKYPKFFTW